MVDLSEALQKLHLVEKAAVSMEDDPDDDYVLHLDAQSCGMCGSRARLAATSSNHTVSLYSRNNLALTGSIQGHDKVLIGVKFAKKSTDLIFTAAQDGVIKSWDMRASLTSPVQTYEGYTETHNIFTAFDVSCDDKILCAGTEQKSEEVHFIFWDCRKGDRLGVYSESHNDDITQVMFHPEKTDLVISGSTDGLVNMFDIKEAEEDDALQETFNSESSVGRIGWCGKDYSQVFCLTHIETLHIWETDEFDPVFEMTDIKDKFQENPHIDYLTDCFQTKDSSDPLLLAGDNSGAAHLLRISGHDLEYVSSLTGGHKDVVRCATWDQQEESLVTGGEDSMLCLWSTNQSVRSHSKTGLHSKKSTSKLKAKGKKKSGAKPY